MLTFPDFVRRLGLALAALIVGLGLWAFWLEPASLRVNTYELPLRDAAAPLAGLRIAALSDLHAGAPFIDAAKLRRVAALTNAARPDLIVIAGDIFAQKVPGGVTIAPQVVADALAGLSAPLGVYAVLGNHDEGDLADLYRSELRRVGITPLDNDVRRIAVGDRHFWLAGFADLETGGPLIAATLAKVSDDAPVIALTHNPELFPAVPARINLLIAGHTHGGQVRLSIFSRALLRNIRDRKDDMPYLRGHYREQTDLFVTTGIGTSDFPVRFRVPPEISLLLLRQDETP
ncbi:MAG: metallophosphoesterase [Nevskia sp.]|nr:metallophosphoesterase [Nevskia sp.]